MGNGVSVGAAEVVRETERALLVKLESGEECWIPKSVIHDDSECYADAHGTYDGDLVVEAWFAVKEGLG